MNSIRAGRMLSLVLLATTSIAAGGQQSTLSLREAIDRALGRNPQAEVAIADRKAAEAQVGMAQTALLPHLNFTEDISRGNDPVFVFGTRLRQQRFTASDFALNSLNRPAPIGNFATKLNGSWMLFNWFETRQQLRSARLAAESASSMGNQVNQGIVLQVVQAYQAVLYAERQIEVTSHEEQTAAALLKDAQTRVKAGLAVDSDVLAAQVNAAQRQQERIATEGRLDTAWAELEAAMGGPVSPRPALKAIDAKSFPEGVLADAVRSALKTRPDLKALQQQTAAQREAVKASRSDFLPQVGAYGNWEMDRQTFAGNGGNNWVAGVQLTVDILPLGKRAHLALAQAAREKAEAQERADEQQIRLAVNRAWTGHQTSERMLATARASLDQAAEDIRILRNRYGAGLATMTDLLRAEDAQRQTHENYWRAAYGNAVAYAELLYATGQLTPDSAETLQ